MTAFIPGTTVQATFDIGGESRPVEWAAQTGEPPLFLGELFTRDPEFPSYYLPFVQGFADLEPDSDGVGAILGLPNQFIVAFSSVTPEPVLQKAKRLLERYIGWPMAFPHTGHWSTVGHNPALEYFRILMMGPDITPFFLRRVSITRKALGAVGGVYRPYFTNTGLVMEFWIDKEHTQAYDASKHVYISQNLRTMVPTARPVQVASAYEQGYPLDTGTRIDFGAIRTSADQFLAPAPRSWNQVKTAPGLRFAFLDAKLIPGGNPNDIERSGLDLNSLRRTTRSVPWSHAWRAYFVTDPGADYTFPAELQRKLAFPQVDEHVYQQYAADAEGAIIREVADNRQVQLPLKVTAHNFEEAVVDNDNEIILKPVETITGEVITPGQAFPLLNSDVLVGDDVYNVESWERESAGRAQVTLIRTPF